MELLELIKKRRSIRKYLDKKIEKEKLDKILEAGIYAPNPGGRQGTKIILLDDAKLIHEIGIINANAENRDWKGMGVSQEQPSIIDDLTIKSGFYGCPALGIICVQKERMNQVNQIGAAFVCAQNMVLQAYELGVGSCIVGRAEATFSDPECAKLLKKWNLDEAYFPLVFVCLGYIDGEYPKMKARNEGRTIYIDENKQSVFNHLD